VTEFKTTKLEGSAASIEKPFRICIQSFGLEDLNRKGYSCDLGIDESVVLKDIIEK